jgi:hypothetical protein
MISARPVRPVGAREKLTRANQLRDYDEWELRQANLPKVFEAGWGCDSKKLICESQREIGFRLPGQIGLGSGPASSTPHDEFQFIGEGRGLDRWLVSSLAGDSSRCL